MCGGTDKVRPVPSRKPLPYWCGECRRHFSVRTGTVMHRSKIGLQKWAIAIYLWSVSLKGVSSMRLHRDLKITQKSAYFMAQRLREAWTEGHGGMAGPVEIDETSAAQARAQEARAGRGAVGKTTVAGARDRATNTISAAIDAKTLQGFVVSRAAEGAKVYTDQAAAYKGMPFEVRAGSSTRDTSQEAAGRSGRCGQDYRCGARDRATNTISAAIVENTDAKTLQGFVAHFASGRGRQGLYGPSSGLQGLALRA